MPRPTPATTRLGERRRVVRLVPHDRRRDPERRHQVAERRRAEEQHGAHCPAGRARSSTPARGGSARPPAPPQQHLDRGEDRAGWARPSDPRRGHGRRTCAGGAAATRHSPPAIVAVRRRRVREERDAAREGHHAQSVQLRGCAEVLPRLLPGTSSRTGWSSIEMSARSHAVRRSPQRSSDARHLQGGREEQQAGGREAQHAWRSARRRGRSGFLSRHAGYGTRSR